ncbi:MAG: glycosyltransferase [Patescibacteria group bacterium]
MASKKERVTVIYPLYNPNIEFLAKSLKSLVKDDADIIKDMILVDDGSQNPVMNYTNDLQDIFPRIKIIRQENKGAAGARNTGLDLAKTDVVAFLDWDCVPHRGWLKIITTPILENQAVATGGKTLTYKDFNIFSDFSDFRKALREPVRDSNGDIIIIITANAAFSKKVLDCVGKFDTKFRKAGGEDLDLTYRLTEAGYSDRMLYVPSAVVEHLHRSNLVSFLKQQFNYGFWDMFHFVYRGRNPMVMGVRFPTPLNILRQIKDIVTFSIGLIPTVPRSYGFLKKYLLFPLIAFSRRFAVMLGGIKCYYFYAPKVLKEKG